MWINNYPEMIAESYEELLKREKRLRGSPLESRIKMLDGNTDRRAQAILGESSNTGKAYGLWMVARGSLEHGDIRLANWDNMLM